MLPFKTGSILVWILFVVLFKVPAQKQYVFQHLSTENGLSHGSVSGMIKDSRGFMWFATWDGVNRYDGIEFKTFKPGAGSLDMVTSNRIEKILEDKNGNIWVVTFDGIVFRLNRLTEQFDKLPMLTDATERPNITGVSTSSSGDVYIRSNNMGLFRVVTNAISNQFIVEHLHVSSKKTLPGDNVFFVIEDSNQNVWINTDKGLVAFERNAKTNDLQPLNTSLFNKILQKHYPLTASLLYNETLFLGTASGQLLMLNYHQGLLNEVVIDNNKPISTLTSNHKGQLFLGTPGNGVFVFDINKKRITKHYQHPFVNHVLAMYADLRHNLWVETTEAGISKINLLNGNVRHYQQKLNVAPDIRPGAQCGIMEDADSTLWMMLKGGGFGYYNPVLDEVAYFFNHPDDRQSKVSNFVNGFYKDASGVLWMSTYFKGIEKVTETPQRFRFVQPAPQVNLSIANEVRAILEDSKGIVWVATKNQELYLLDDDLTVLKKFDLLNGSPIGMVYCMMEDNSGTIYFGTKGNGLFTLKPTGHLRYDVAHYLNEANNPQSLSNNNIYALHQDVDGNIWVGTYGGGVNIFKNHQFIHRGNTLQNYPKNTALKVRHITGDGKGNVWIATTEGLVFAPLVDHFQDCKFKVFNAATGNIKGLRGSDVFWIATDDDKKIWVASLGGGLAQLKNYPAEGDTLHFDALGKTDGLPSDVIFTMLTDGDGNIWMSSENGIGSYHPKSKTFRNFGRSDGIVTPVFSEGAAAVSANGTLFFGSNNGFYAFRPSNFEPVNKQIDIVFTSLQVLGKEVVPGNKAPIKMAITEADDVELTHLENQFTIAWAGLDFNLSDKLLYAYKLDGFDSEWRYAGHLNHATYSKLPAGTYTFSVRLANPELGNPDYVKTITVNVLPPFWKTWWAYFLYALFALILLEITRRIVTTIIKLRNKVIIEHELSEIKMRFFTNVSHELRTPLTLILGPAEAIKNDESISSQSKVYTSLIEQNAIRLLRMVTQLLDFRKVQSNKMELMTEATNLCTFIELIGKSFNELAKNKVIQFNIVCANEPVWAMIDREKMESVVYNLLSNAFKFTPKNGIITVKVFVSNNNQQACIEVSDSGPGISKEQEASLFQLFASHRLKDNAKVSGSGIGLALAKELVLLHHGQLIYKPAPTGGSIFSILLATGQIPESNSDFAESYNEDFSPAFHYSEPQTQQIIHNLPCALVVDDNAELRQFIRLQFEGQYRIEEAANGAEGYKKALELQPDIILSDVMMPEMDGIQLLDKIKHDFNTSHIPVVLLTAKTSVESKIEGLRYGADAYLTKPFHSGQLKAQFDNLLLQRELLRKRFASLGTQNAPFEDVTITDGDNNFLKKVTQIIEDNMMNPDFKVSDIYAEIGMGRTKFFDKLKGLTGSSPIDFIKESRLNRARHLLEMGQYNITEVSYMSGFTDSGYFSKCFKEHFGFNPSVIKKHPND